MKSHNAVNVVSALAAVIAIVSACGGGTPREDVATIAGSDSQALGDVGMLAYDIGNAMGSPVRTGNTCGAFNEWTPPCVPSSSAADNTFWWRAPYTGTFNFNTFVPWYVTSYDTVLHVYDNGSSALLGCNDDASGLQSSVSANLIAGQQIRIVVDGWGNRCGSYWLNIACQGPNCPTWTSWTSEEYPPINCVGSTLINRMACRGNYCDDIRAYCDVAMGSRTGNGGFMNWTFSEENYPNGQTCPSGTWLTGVSCWGSNCDNMSVQCSYQSGVSQSACGWYPWTFSDENGENGQALPAGMYAAGLRCTDSYCDNMSIYACTAK